MRPALSLRPATPDDAPALAAIYAPYVRSTPITFEYEPPTAEAFAGRIAQTLTRFPYLVACVDGVPAGYAYASPFHTRAAYGWDTELSIYLDPAYLRLGLGSRLYRALLDLLRAQQMVTAYACITTPNPASIAFHQALGFTQVGAFPRAGWKFESFHDIVYLELPLRQRVTRPAPVIPFPALDPALVRDVCARYSAQ